MRLENIKTLYFTELQDPHPDVPILGSSARLTDLVSLAAHSKYRCCLIVDEKSYFRGVVTQGDLLRLAEAGRLNDDSVASFLESKKKKPIVALTTAQAVKKMERTGAAVVPLVDTVGKLLGSVVEQSGAKCEEAQAQDQWLSVIMAGGRGERLYPLTADMPKPLLYLGDQTMIEHVFDALESVGVQSFNLMVGHLSHKFEEFRELSARDFELFVEDEPLGTGGPFLKWLKESRQRIDEIIESQGRLSVVVCNADLLFDIPAEKMSEFVSSDCDISILSRKIVTEIKYGVLTTTEEGLLARFEEKPILAHMVNTGIYFFRISRQLLMKIDEIDVGPVDMPDLILMLRDGGGLKVCVSEIQGNYIDMGTPEDLKLVTKLLAE